MVTYYDTVEKTMTENVHYGVLLSQICAGSLTEISKFQYLKMPIQMLFAALSIDAFDIHNSLCTRDVYAKRRLIDHSAYGPLHKGLHVRYILQRR